MPKTTPRSVVIARVAGVLIGLAVAIVVVVTTSLGISLTLAPAIAALGLLAGVVVGEVLVRAPVWDGETGATGLRAVAGAIPRGLGIGLLGAVGALIVVLVVGITTATGDDLGRSGRALELTCVGGTTSTATPWMGSFYSVPLGVVVAVGVVLALAGLVLGVRRPRGGTVADGDDVLRLRQRSARAISEAAAALVGLSIGPAALVTGTVLVNIGCGSVWLRIIGWILLIVAVIAALAALRYVARLLFGPGGRQPRHGGA